MKGGTITAAGTDFCHSFVGIFVSFFSAFLLTFLVRMPKDSAFEDGAGRKSGMGFIIEICLR